MRKTTGSLRTIATWRQTLTCLLLSGIVFTAPGALAEGLVFVDADDGANGPANLSPLENVHTSNVSDDNLWGYRSFGAAQQGGIFQTVYEAGGGPATEDVPEITQTITGLVADTPFDVYVAYWQGAAGAHDWNIRAGFASDELALFNTLGPTEDFPEAQAGAHSGLHIWDEPPFNPATSSPMYEEGGRTLLLGKVGTTDSSGTGEIGVILDDLPTLGYGQPSNYRSWLEGVAYAPAGESVFISPGDLNVSGDIDPADAEILLQNLHSDVSGLTLPETYQLGDLNLDRVIDHQDFAAFKPIFNDALGDGALEAMMAQVPEPTSLALVAWGMVFLVGCGVRCRRNALSTLRQGGHFSALARLAVGCMATWVVSGTCWAAPVENWMVDPDVGAGDPASLSSEGTSAPTIGDGSPDSASAVAMFADIAGALDASPDITINSGEQITLSGSASFTGIESVLNQFRFGLFYEAGPTVDNAGWLGYIGNNSAASTGGSLTSKNPNVDNFESTTFISTTGNRAINLQVRQDGGTMVDGTYDFTMTAKRYGDDLMLDASLTSEAGWSQVWSNAEVDDPDRVTFDYNRVGFLTGGAMAADNVQFADIDVSTNPIEALTLHVRTEGPDAGNVEIRNSSGNPIDFDYYEIHSEAGALDLDEWDSFDSQEGDDPVTEGWDVATNSDNSLLSEVNFTSALTVDGASPLSLGSAFQVDAEQDLEFYFGLPDGPLVRGLVQYVGEGVMGDYNGDGIVNAADYVVWRNTLDDEVSPGSGADGNNNGTIDNGDYTIWSSNFGSMAGAGGAPTAAVPEPATLWLLPVALVVAAGCCRGARP